jgi:hypothetical protein
VVIGKKGCVLLGCDAGGERWLPSHFAASCDGAPIAAIEAAHRTAADCALNSLDSLSQVNGKDGVSPIIVKVSSGGHESSSELFKWTAAYKTLAFFTFVWSLLLLALILKASVHEQVKL